MESCHFYFLICFGMIERKFDSAKKIEIVKNKMFTTNKIFIVHKSNSIYMLQLYNET
jgi:hypothetical protein